MRSIIIVAMGQGRVIGRNGKLPWHDSEDLKHFKRTTTGHAIIMGRKTFESIGKALPDRRNIIITRQRDFAASGVDVVHSLSDALDLCRRRGEEEAFIIGGAKIYEQALPIADEMIVTEMPEPAQPGDTLFPPWNAADWSPVGAVEHDPRIRRYVREKP